MIKPNKPITSREYKLMLNTDRFIDRDEGAKNFFNLLELLIKKEKGSIDDQDGETRRQTSYFDTPEFTLRQNGFALRLRKEGNDLFQLNLKCRNSDRYISATKDVVSTPKGKMKFEEDIIPPFISKFSNSNSIELDTKPELKTIKDVTAFFPGLKALHINVNAPVKVANDFKVLEIERKLGKFQFEESTLIKAGLSFWYLKKDTNFPIVGEFSFAYEAGKTEAGELEAFSIKTVEGADRVFRALQNQAGWLDFNITTKTSFALDVL